MFASSPVVISVLAALAVLSQDVLASSGYRHYDSLKQAPSRSGLSSKKARRAHKLHRAAADAQTSLQLDPSQIGPNLALTGQEVPAAGQVDSQTSVDNFINFCLTQNVPLTNGTQLTTGSCNPIPMGRIIGTDKLPATRFTFPPNGGAIKANTNFTLKMTVVNLDAGHFTNPTVTYYAAPQTVNGNGVAIGHSHVVIETISSIATTDLPDPRNFKFFKGLNDAADGNGQLSTTVAGGLPVGIYKMSSIIASSNHQPLLVAVAQHGTLDDSVYFEVTADGKAGGAFDNAASSDVASASSSSTTSTATDSAAASATNTAASSTTDSASTASTTAAGTSKNTNSKNANNKNGNNKGAVDNAAVQSTTANVKSTTTAATTQTTSSVASTLAAASQKGDKKGQKSGGRNQ